MLIKISLRTREAVKKDLMLSRQSQQLDTSIAVMVRRRGSVTDADTIKSTPVKEKRVKKKILHILFPTSAKADRN